MGVTKVLWPFFSFFFFFANYQNNLYGEFFYRWNYREDILKYLFFSRWMISWHQHFFILGERKRKKVHCPSFSHSAWKHPILNLPYPYSFLHWDIQIRVRESIGRKQKQRTDVFSTHFLAIIQLEVFVHSEG